MFKELEKINEQPRPFEYYTADELWTNEHTSAQMLKFHLNESIDVSSRNVKFVEKSVDWIISRFGIDDSKHIIDFGCGPGLYTSRLAASGAKITGIDFSGRSIEYARKEAEEKQLAINYIQEDYLEFETIERFDLAIMIMCDFCALGPTQRKRMLNKFYCILKSGGHVLLDVYSLAAFDKREQAAIYEENLLDGFWSPDKYYGFLNTWKYVDEKVVLDKYTIVEEQGVKTVFNWLQYFTPKELEDEFRECGFDIEGFCGDVAGSPFNEEADEFAVVARKN